MDFGPVVSFVFQESAPLLFSIFASISWIGLYPTGYSIFFGGSGAFATGLVAVYLAFANFGAVIFFFATLGFI